MAIVELTAELTRDSTGLADKRPWYVYAASYTGGSDGVVTTKRSKPIYPVGSTLTIRVEGGIVAYIENPEGKKYLVDIPETDGDLWPVIEAGEAYPPDTPLSLLTAAVAQAVIDNADSLTVDDVERVADTLAFKRGGETLGTPVDISDLVFNGDMDDITDAGAAGKAVARSETDADVRAASGAGMVGDSLFTADTGAEARELIRAADEAASGAMRRLMVKLTRGVSDAVWGNVGDSTGNESWEWVYLTAQWLASQFPAYTVLYRLWDTGTDDYAAAVTIQTGTGTGNGGGPFTLTVWNASVAGSTTGYFQGYRFTTAFVNKSADLLTVNYGHNQGGPVDTELFRQFQRNKYLSFMDDYVAANPSAGVVCILQNPSIENPPAAPGRPFAWQAQRQVQFETAARWRGWGVIDVFQAYIDHTGWETDYLSADGLHPNASGQAAWAAQVIAALERAAKVSVTTQAPAHSAPGKQLVTNPEFASWTGTNPDGVTMSTSPACVASKELADWETSGVAMLLTADAASGQPYAQWGGTAASWGLKSIAEQNFTAMVRIKVPASNTSTVRVTLIDNFGAAQSTTADVEATCRDRYAWVYVTKFFAAGATSLWVRVSPRTSGTAVVTCLVDRIYLVPGTVPSPHGGAAPVIQVGPSSVTFGGSEVQTAAEANMDRLYCDSTAFMSNASGVAVLAYFTAKQDITLNYLQAFTGSTAASGLTLAKLAVYSVDPGTGDLTRLGVTANNTAMFGATYSTGLSREALLASVALTEGMPYAFAVLQVGTTVATMQGKGPAGLANEHFRAPRLSGIITGQTDLSASYLAASVGAKSGVPYIVGTT